MAKGKEKVDEQAEAAKAGFAGVMKQVKKIAPDTPLTKAEPGVPEFTVSTVVANLALVEPSPQQVETVLLAIQAKTPASRSLLKSMWDAARKAGRGAGGDDAPPTQAETLLNILNEADLWHDQDSTGFASFERDGHRETVWLNGQSFKNWLHWRFHAETGGVPGADTMRSVIANAEGRAALDGEEHRSWIRVAEHEGSLYLDLCDKAWTTIEIDAAGWRVVKDPPVRFRRGGGRPLPIPVAGGSVDAIWDFVNITDEADRKLFLAWAVAAFRPRFPLPILDLSGETGSAKTTAMRILRRLIDPCTADGRGLPKDEDDLMVSAVNNWCVTGDNVSSFDRAMANALCRLSTGGGLSKRGLYTNSDEVTLNALRPIVVTGLSRVSEQQDLLDRMLLVRLPVIDDKDKEQERIIWEQFEKARPRILGALLDAVSTAIRRLPEIKIKEPPRMADFAAWAEAGGAAFGWEAGSFVTAYKDACQDLLKDVAGADLLTGVIVEYLKSTTDGKLEGTASELLVTLNKYLGDGPRRRSKDWPGRPNWLSRKLNEIPKGLRAAGVDVGMRKDSVTRVNTWVLTLRDEGAREEAPGQGDEEATIPF